jgi:UDP-N-acetylglucosamine 2-epimerase (non-hydrolysing)
MRDPDIELGCQGETDTEIGSQLLAKLHPVLQELNPDAVAFLGDTNTLTGALAAMLLNIPIIHIEGCWHSYDWRMPEEKYRTIGDHIADVIYTYEEEYKIRGIAEGLNPKNIVVVRNPIVDILNEFYFKQKKRLQAEATPEFFATRGITKGEYYFMTCHRRENVHITSSLKTILAFVAQADKPVYFPASYRTQKILQAEKIKLPKNCIMVDPIGYEELLMLITNCKAIFTDSGTLSEEASVLQIPCVNIRKSTERPQIYDVRGAVKFDPSEPKKYPPKLLYKKLAAIIGTTWKHTLGDGKSSQRIARDIIKRLRTGKLRGHLPADNHLPISRSFIEDGIVV